MGVTACEGVLKGSEHKQRALGCNRGKEKGSMADSKGNEVALRGSGFQWRAVGHNGGKQRCLGCTKKQIEGS